MKEKQNETRPCRSYSHSVLRLLHASDADSCPGMLVGFERCKRRFELPRLALMLFPQ